MVKLSIPNTADIEKTSSGKLSYRGYVPGKKVAKGLYVGSVVDSANMDFMKKHNITVVINCTRDLPFRFNTQSHIRLPVDDAYEHTLRLFEHWKTAVPRISSYIDQGRNVLVHCRAGQQRSMATVAAVLMYREGLTAMRAVERCRKVKSDAFWPRINFHRSLLKWQTYVKEHKPYRASSSL